MGLGATAGEGGAFSWDCLTRAGTIWIIPAPKSINFSKRQFNSIYLYDGIPRFVEGVFDKQARFLKVCFFLKTNLFR